MSSLFGAVVGQGLGEIVGLREDMSASARERAELTEKVIQARLAGIEAKHAGMDAREAAISSLKSVESLSGMIANQNAENRKIFESLFEMITALSEQVLKIQEDLIDARLEIKGMEPLSETELDDERELE